MTIENPNVVDAMGISKTDGKAALTIADHLDWADEKPHFEAIEKKIGSYLGFIKSGQLLESLPEAKGRSVRIELVHQYTPSEAGIRFLEAAKRQLQTMGLEFAYKSLPPKYWPTREA